MSNEAYLTKDEVERIVVAGLDKLPLAGKRVLVIVPDQTRTMPLPMFFRLLTRTLRPRAQAVDFLVALGTHPPLDDGQMLRLFGLTADERASTYADVGLLNHAWRDPNALTTLGVPEVRVIGPRTLLPTDVERLGVRVFHDMTEGLKGVDVVIMLRLQNERMRGAAQGLIAFILWGIGNFMLAALPQDAGLGLPIVLRLVRRLGGRIKASAPHAGGTVFSLSLPVKEAVAAQ